MTRNGHKIAKLKSSIFWIETEYRKFFLKETYAKSFRLFSSVRHGQSSFEVLIQAKVAKLESFLKENYGNWINFGKCFALFSSCDWNKCSGHYIHQIILRELHTSKKEEKIKGLSALEICVDYFALLLWKFECLFSFQNSLPFRPKLSRCSLSKGFLRGC